MLKRSSKWEEHHTVEAEHFFLGLGPLFCVVF